MDGIRVGLGEPVKLVLVDVIVVREGDLRLELVCFTIRQADEREFDARYCMTIASSKAQQGWRLCG